MVESAVNDFGYVDILVHNAGIASRGRSVADTEVDELERLVRVHALSAHQLARHVLPSMRTRPRGDIVMISSVATSHYAANGAPYNMGKAALEALAFGLAKEERDNGIHVNVVAPGLVETEMGRRLVKAGGVEDITTLGPLLGLRPGLSARRRRRRRGVLLQRGVGLHDRPAHRSRRRRPQSPPADRLRTRATMRRSGAQSPHRAAPGSTDDEVLVGHRFGEAGRGPTEHDEVVLPRSVVGERGAGCRRRGTSTSRARSRSSARDTRGRF